MFEIGEYENLDVKRVVKFGLILLGIAWLCIIPLLFPLFKFPIPSLLILSASVLVPMGMLSIIKGYDKPVSIYVCGECSKKFFKEFDLRKHYVTEHIKK